MKEKLKNYDSGSLVDLSFISPFKDKNLCSFNSLTS